MPTALLAASLYSLSTLTRHNEITAMRASGVSLFRLMYPFLGVALICSVLCTLIQEEFARANCGAVGGPMAVDDFVALLVR